MLNLLRTVREYIKYLPAKLFNFHKKGDKEDIFLFSSPRSGSTWLMEIISSQRNIKYINEPLHTNRHKGYLTDIEPTWSEIYSDHNRRDKFVHFLKRLLDDELFVGQQKLKHIYKGEFDFFTDRKIFKILRAKDLINVFEKKFEIKIIYLLRHPIPVALSLVKENMEQRAYHYLNNDIYCEKFLNQDLIDFSKRLLREGTEFEIRILQWCLENIAPLKFLDNKNWLIVTYEDLVINGEETVARLYNFLDLKDYNLAIEQLSRPSRTTVDDKTKNQIKEENKDYLIKKWENQISEEEREKAFCIINQFGLDIYDKESYFIDYNYLN